MARYRVSEENENGDIQVYDKDKKEIVAIFFNKKRARDYTEILNCQHDNLATILRQISEDDDG